MVVIIQLCMNRVLLPKWYLQENALTLALVYTMQFMCNISLQLPHRFLLLQAIQLWGVWVYWVASWCCASPSDLTRFFLSNFILMDTWLIQGKIQGCFCCYTINPWLWLLLLFSLFSLPLQAYECIVMDQKKQNWKPCLSLCKFNSAFALSLRRTDNTDNNKVTTTHLELPYLGNSSICPRMCLL